MKKTKILKGFHHKAAWPDSLQCCKPYSEKLSAWRAVQIEGIKSRVYKESGDIVSIEAWEAIETKLREKHKPLPEKTGDFVRDVQGVINSAFSHTGFTSFRVKYTVDGDIWQPDDNRKQRIRELNAAHRIKGDM